MNVLLVIMLIVSLLYNLLSHKELTRYKLLYKRQMEIIRRL